MKLKGARILITGGLQRLGREIALDLAKRGAFLLIHHCHSDPSSLQEELWGQADFFQADFRHRQEVESFLEKVNQTGGVDGLINNSSIFYPTPHLSQMLESWDDFFQINLQTPLHLAYGLATQMKQWGRGKIINLGDIYGEIPLANHIPYCLSKAGLLMLTKSLALEFAPEIQVNAISPGALLFPEGASEKEKTARRKKIPLGREGHPRDLTQTVAYLLENDYITGQNIRLDGGRSISG